MKKIMSLVLVFVMVFAFAGCGHSNEGNYYIEETGKTYQYEIKMSGTLPNAANPSSFYVYTDDANLSFEKLSQRLLSSQKRPELDFYISADQIAKVD